MSPGNRGIDACIDGYIRALAEHYRDARHYIINTVWATPELIEHKAGNNISADVQPLNRVSVMTGITGEKRAVYYLLLKTLFDKGIRVAGSSKPQWYIRISTEKTKRCMKIMGNW